MTFDFSNGKARPSAARVIAAWKKAGCPTAFSVQYGETDAEFTRHEWGWDNSGNGCRGVDRSAVVKALNTACKGTEPEDDVDWPWDDVNVDRVEEA